MPSFSYIFKFCYIFILFLFVAKRPFIKHVVIFVVFVVFLRVPGRYPHLKTGRSARVAVSPPISTKKININFGWCGYVGIKGWAGVKRVWC